MATKENPPQINDLREQIDYLETQIRNAEMAASQRLEGAAPIQALYKWKAPERIHERKQRPWYIGIALIVIFVIMYAALTANYMLIVAMIMLLMLLYALNAFPPKIIEHEITNKGLNVFGQLYLWNRIEGFWVSQRGKSLVINIDLVERRVKRMILLVGEGDAKRIVRELVMRIDYINPGATRQDLLSKLTEGKHLPLTDFLDVFEESEKLESKAAKSSAKPAQEDKLTSK